MARVIDLIVDTLEQAGIDHVFGLPGGITPFLLEECYKRENKIKTIIARHEGAAAVMADMYGRITHKPGVLIGQGIWIATNGGFGIAEAFLAGSPMVVITEFSDWFGKNLRAPYQTGTGEYGTINLPNIFRSMAKYVTISNTPEELLYGVQLAIKHATSGRPGPAVVISKWNTMMGNIDEEPLNLDPPIYPIQKLLNVKPPALTKESVEAITNKLITAEKPVMICGRGTFVSQAASEVQILAEKLGIPVVTSYMGKGIIPETHDLALGVMGSLGQELADAYIAEADVLFVLGSCLAPDNTKNCKSDFIDCSEQEVIQIDIDPRNAGWTYALEAGYTADIKTALISIIQHLENLTLPYDPQDRIKTVVDRKNDPKSKWFTSRFWKKEKLPMEPEIVVKAVNDIIGEDDLIILDGGNNRMWFTQLFQTKKSGQLIGPGGAAGMAWCSSAVISAQLLHPDKRVIGIIGDGGLLMSLYNLETCRQLELPIKYIVLNNASLGNVRDYMSRKGKKITEYPESNFANIAQSMGLEGYRVETIEDLKPILQKALTNGKPTVVDIIVKKASHLRIKH